MAGPQAMMVLAVCAAWQVTSSYYTNLLVNPSFETDIKNNWRSNGFLLARYQGDVLHGLYSIKCSGRTMELDGPFQQGFEFLKGRHYAFEGYVKLLRDVPGKPWQTIKVVLQMTVPFQKESLSYNIVYRSFCSTSNGWIRMKGDIEAPQVDFTSPKIAIRGPYPGVDFLVDNLTLYELPENPNWRQQADVNIEAYRKANVTINVSLPPGVSAEKIELEISQKSHDFAFGSMLNDEEILTEPTSRYMQIANYMFDWATVQNYKWKYNKGKPESSVEDYSIATDATDKLVSKGKKVRGHCILWDLDKNIPEWVQNLSKQETMPALHRHMEYMINLTRNRLQQMDIMNEHIAGHYYEEKLNDPSVTVKMFQQARALKTPVKLYLNDFQCVTTGAQTEQYYDLAMRLLSYGPILDGLGVQGHTKEYIKPDPTQIWRRLDRLAETGLELMMTEFDIAWSDEVVRADWLEDSIRAFFSHPKLRGVILWDFWNKTMSERNKALVADNYKILESGQRYACLVRKEWTTHTRFNVGSRGTTTTLRAFQGQYDVVIRRSGIPVQMISLYNGKQGATWNINVTASTAAITVPVTEDLVPQCVSHRDERSLGTATSTSTFPTPILSCRTLQSSPSGPGENDAVSVTCRAGEVLTGCSSVHLNNSWTRKGEKILMADKTATCTAYNGHRSPSGVVASARCCQLSGLSCDYIVAGPSYPLDGAMAEARCPSGRKAIGCSGYSAYPDFDGVRPSNVTLSGCLAQSGAPYFSDPAQKSGVVAFSVCCQAPSLTCQVLQSAPSGLTPGSQSWVACPAGHVMTACNVMAPSGRAAGARVYYDGAIEKCTAFMGDNLPLGSAGATAMATCCRVLQGAAVAVVRNPRVFSGCCG